MDETATLNPVTPYAESKVLVERDLAPLADNNFTTTYLRSCDGVWCFSTFASGYCPQ